MKKSILFFAFYLMISALLYAQAPAKFNYQAAVRNASGTILANQSVNFRLSIKAGSASGTTIYSETNLVVSNAAGLVNINVGSGTPVWGSMSNIDWTANLYFLSIEMDITGGTNFQLMGTQQLVSVPYALDAKIAEKAKDLQLPFANINYETNTNFSIENGASGKIMNLKRNATSGTQPVLDIDNLSTDLNATTLRVSSSAGTTSSFNAGNSGTAAYFNAPGGNAIQVGNGSVGIGTGFPQQKLDVNGGIRIGNTAVQSPGSIRYNGNNFEGYNGTAWVQLNGGGSPDNWGTQAVVTDPSLVGNGTVGSPLTIAPQGAGTGDVLKWNGTTWAPAADQIGSGSSDWTAIGSGNIINTNIGSVNIGVANPDGKLNVDNGTYVNGIYSQCNNGSGAAVSASNTNSGVGVLGENYGLGTGIGVKGYSIHGKGGVFTSDDGVALVTEQGNIGFGVNAPEEKLEVAGAIKIGNNIDATPADGTIRYTPANGFEIRHANTWTAIKNFWNTNNGIDAYNLNSGNVGIGTSTPGAKLEVAGQVKITGGIPGTGKVLTSDANGLASWQTPATGTNYNAGTGINIAGNTITNTGDLSNTNEIQSLSLSGNSLSLSNGGGSVTLPTITTYTAGNGISITGNTITNTGDLSNTNELQTISKTGNTISLSNGGGSVSDADAQTLSLTGNTLSISGGNAVTLPSGGGSGTNYWTLNANNHIAPNNSGNVLIGDDANGSSGAKLEVKKDAVFGKVVSFSNSGSSYTTIVDVVDNGTSGNPAAGVGSVGNAAIRASSVYGDALFANASNGRGIYLMGGNSFGYPAMQIDLNPGATVALDLQGQIKIAGGNPGTGKVLTSDINGLATWQTPAGGASYTAGTGISISGNTVAALNTNALWNANKLQGNTVSSATPTNGQVLQYSAGQWIPATPAASSNIYDNISEHYQSGSAQASSGTPEVDIPGLSKTFTVTGNAKVVINTQVGIIAGCTLCADHQAALELNVDGNAYIRSYYSLDNLECTQATINKIVSLTPGTHTIKIKLIWLNGSAVTAGNVIGCYSSNEVYMDAMVINQ